MTAKLKTGEREAALRNLPQWVYDAERDAISRVFKFADFSKAFAFMAEIALRAEKADHHPEWSNIYNQVSITLTTHDVNGLSQKDIDLATKIDACYAD
jgi:4a-hydroxytetrahydrobiopterin dehydratase